MNKRWLILMLCMGCALLLTGCTEPVVRTTNPLAGAAATLVPDTDPVLPRLDDATLHSRDTATLFFRYGTEPYLASESRTIPQSASQSYETALLTQLLSGPGTQSTELRSLFPEGTRVLSTVKQGRTLFVTLSAEIMNMYPDEPNDWRSQDAWRTESPLRRLLCMQSLVATVTENCDVDQVQLLVQQTGDAVGSLRLKQNYFLDGSPDSVLVGPMTRRASLLLGPDNTLSVVLDCWVSQDWQRLYLYIADHDPQLGTESLPLSGFITVMNTKPALVSWQAGSASISADGTCATFAVDLTLLSADGQLTSVTGRTLRLYRENGLWKTSLNQLTGWLEE